MKIDVNGPLMFSFRCNVINLDDQLLALAFILKYELKVRRGCVFLETKHTIGVGTQ